MGPAAGFYGQSTRSGSQKRKRASRPFILPSNRGGKYPWRGLISSRNQIGISAELPSIQTAAEIVRSCNVRRRQLSTVELARLANTEATRGAGGDHKPFGINAEWPPTQAEAAAKWGVAVRTIGQVRAIDESDEEDLKEALRAPLRAPNLFRVGLILGAYRSWDSQLLGRRG